MVRGLALRLALGLGGQTGVCRGTGGCGAERPIIGATIPRACVVDAGTSLYSRIFPNLMWLKLAGSVSAVGCNPMVAVGKVVRSVERLGQASRGPCGRAGAQPRKTRSIPTRCSNVTTIRIAKSRADNEGSSSMYDRRRRS